MKVNKLIIYRCDPDKNKDCLANNCYRNGGPCMYETNKKYKMNIFKRIKEVFIYGNYRKNRRV